MKGAVQAAFAFAKDMFPQAKDIRLEEVEPGSVGWTVVISFSTGEPGTIAQVMGGGAPRLFKTIAVDSASGTGAVFEGLEAMSSHQELLIDRYKAKGYTNRCKSCAPLSGWPATICG